MKTADRTPISANEFRGIRARMDMTQTQMARALGHKHGRVVRRWELGEISVPQTVSRALALIERLPKAIRTQVITWLKDQSHYDGYEK